MWMWDIFRNKRSFCSLSRFSLSVLMMQSFKAVGTRVLLFSRVPCVNLYVARLHPLCAAISQFSSIKINFSSYFLPFHPLSPSLPLSPSFSPPPLPLSPSPPQCNIYSSPLILGTLFVSIDLLVLKAVFYILSQFFLFFSPANMPREGWLSIPNKQNIKKYGWKKQASLSRDIARWCKDMILFLSG